MTNLETGLEILLNGVDENIQIVEIENISADDNFSVQIRTKLKNEDTWSKTCDQWIEKFSIQTNSKWVVKSTYPTVKRIEYRKVYFCKENSIGSRNKQKSCKGKIDIKVKKATEATLKKDKLLQEGYNAQIQINFNHSHDR